MIVLDTDTASLFHAEHPRITNRMAKVDPTEVVATTVVTQAEILRARFEYRDLRLDAQWPGEQQACHLIQSWN